MGTYLEIEADGAVVDGIEAPVHAIWENQALYKIFPKEYWNNDEPKEFDFVANEERARQALKDLLDFVEGGWESGRHPTAWVEEMRHIVIPPERVSTAERRAFAVEWVKDFERLYARALSLQKDGGHPTVMIS